MPTAVANEDHPMDNAPEAEAEANAGTSGEDRFIDLNDQRIRVVSRLISLTGHRLLIWFRSCLVQVKLRHPSSLSQRTIL